MAVLLGALSVVFIVSFQVYWVYKLFDAKEKQFDQQVTIALINVASRIAEFNNSQAPDLSPVTRITSNYFIVDVNESIDPVVLEHFLSSEFNIRNINIDFEYAIYDCESERMVYGNYISNRDGKAKRTSKLKFIMAEDLAYYFGVFFPGKQVYLIRGMNLWIISFLIILTALGFFSYAVFIILRQKRLSEIQKDFINNMTHEFRTPISAIAISAGVLKEEHILDDPERHATYTGIITEQNMKLERHMERVLQSALTEKHPMPLKKEDINLCRLLREIEHTARNHLGKEQRISVICDDEELSVNADVVHLFNIIYNLVDNAIKYGGSTVTIRLSYRSVHGKVSLMVQDDGPGIEGRYRKKVFKRFFRIPGSDPIHGFGVGLNYVRNVCRAHGWKIKLDSTADKGCLFIISRLRLVS